MTATPSTPLRAVGDGSEAGGGSDTGLGGGSGLLPNRDGGGNSPLNPTMFVLLAAFIAAIVGPFLYFPQGLQLVGAIVLPLIVAGVGARVMM
jgi:hypothetical protein